ncbi:MAG: hypothetical protein KKA62_05615 [Nanoarchaeota archaeon]|nr:hypothetical protein [Nanoarchaeota archaeon]MBU1644688.1 hypothetical protein [Nanoarchaeota archaeon]MBU1977401.1 hypothetical protein [Nanoarchaeota archaeon]
MKKASADMWWIIIGAVIALVVMIVLMVMFSGKTSKVETGLSACEGKGGVCVFENEECPSNTLRSTVFDCGQENECCIGTPKECTGTKGCEDCVSDSKGKSWCR